MVSGRYKKIGIVMLTYLIIISTISCGLQTSVIDNQNGESTDMTDNRGSNYVKKVVSRDLVERSNKALDSIGNISDKDKKDEALLIYSELNKALLSRDEEGVKKYLEEIEPLIEQALTLQDPNAKTQEQVMAKAKELETAAVKLEDDDVKTKAVEAYNVAKQLFATGDMGKTWQALVYTEDILKVVDVTGDICIEKYNYIKSLGGKIKDQELLQTAIAQLKSAEQIYGTGDLKNAWFALIDLENMLNTNDAFAEKSTEKNASSETGAPSADDLVKKAGEIKAAVLALADEDLKKQLGERYADAENYFKLSELSKAWGILVDIENELKK